MLARLSLLIAALALIVATVSVGFAVSAAAPDSLRPAGTTRYAVDSAMDSVSTSSTSFVNMPDLSQSITIPSGKRGDVLITFCSTGWMNLPKLLYLRPLVGAANTAPTYIQVRTTGNTEDYCADFYKLNVPAGTRTVRMQWGVESGGTQTMFTRSMIVIVNIHD